MNIPTREQLLKVPEPIRLWLGSEEVVDNLIKIRKLFGIPDEKRSVLPLILASLETKLLSPESVEFEIKRGLEVEDDMAKKIASQVKTAILAPIQEELKTEGIDISKISKSEAGEAQVVKTEKQPETPLDDATTTKKDDETKTEESPVKLSSEEPVVKSPAPPAPQTPPQPSKPATDDQVTTNEPAPFVVQENKSSAPVGDTGGFRLKLDDSLLKKLTPTKKETGEEGSPRAARVEIGKQNEKKDSGIVKTPEERSRVVHYNQFRTPVSEEIREAQQGNIKTGPASMPSASKSRIPLTPNPLFDQNETKEQESDPAPKPPVAPRPPSPPAPPLTQSPPVPKKEPGKDGVDEGNEGEVVDLQSFDS